jgi:hypothetical protein
MSNPDCYVPDCEKCSLKDSCKSYQPVYPPVLPSPYTPYQPPWPTTVPYYTPWPWGTGDPIPPNTWQVNYA